MNVRPILNILGPENSPTLILNLVDDRCAVCAHNQLLHIATQALDQLMLERRMKVVLRLLQEKYVDRWIQTLRELRNEKNYDALSDPRTEARKRP